MFLPCLPFIHGLLSYAMIFPILTVFIILNVKIYYEKNLVTFYLFTVTILIFLTYSSLLNGASLFINTAKLIQLCTIVYFISFSNYIIYCSLSDIVKINKLYIFFNVIFGILIHIIFDGYNEGILRFSGLFFDSNYFALYSFIFFVIIDCKISNKRFLNFINMFMVVLSLSSTVTISLLLYMCMKYLFRNLKFSFIINYSIFVLYGTLLVFLFMITPLILKSYLSYSHLSGFIKYKLHSLTNRFDAQILAYDLLGNTLQHFLFGYGSGRNLELTKIALHSFFIQSLFSHGIFYFFFLLIFLFYHFYVCLKSHDKIYILFSFLFCFLLICGMLDPFLNGFLILFMLLLKSTNSNIKFIKLL